MAVLYVSKETHRLLKAEAAKEGRTLQEFTELIISNALSLKNSADNDVSVKSFKEDKVLNSKKENYDNKTSRESDDNADEKNIENKNYSKDESIGENSIVEVSEKEEEIDPEDGEIDSETLKNYLD